MTPPYAAAFLYGFAQAYLSDKYRIRSPFIIFNAIINIIGCCLLGYVKSTGARYFACFRVRPSHPSEK